MHTQPSTTAGQSSSVNKEKRRRESDLSRDKVKFVKLVTNRQLIDSLFHDILRTYIAEAKRSSIPIFWRQAPPNTSAKFDGTHVTLAATKAIIHELYGDSAAAQITKSKFQVITVWRPLAVPVRDWPLALCDASSVDQADFVDTDVIYPNYIAENRMLHFDADQKWYWLPDQTADEVLVFKAIDSDELLSSPCPHGAFPLPGQDQDTMSRRESIDVRLLVMYADMIYPESKPWAS
ncbi:hypothetical protein RJZ56_007743 [Blastomyces dermatitidis]